MAHREPTLQEWKNGVWDYLLEHCDVTVSGKLFVKFHAGSRKDFEKHIKGRVVYGYHREDPRVKEASKEALEAAHRAEKARKRGIWLAQREERRKVFAELEKRNTPWYRKVREVIHRHLLRTHGRW